MLRANLLQMTMVGLLAVAAVGLAGCGSGKVKIGGEVTVAGEPVVQGTIRFAPADGNGPTDGATIDQGRYTAEVLRGAKTVQIEAFKKVGEAPHDRNDPSSPILPVYETLTKHETTTEVTGASDSLNFDIPAPAATN
jgi:hypothetical protein